MLSNLSVVVIIVKKRKIIIRKTISFISGLLLILQSIVPSALFITQAHAQAVTPTEEVTPAIDPTPTIAPTITETPTPTEEATPTPEPTIITPTPTEVIQPTETGPPATPTPEQGQILDGASTVASQWTFEKVELNKEYIDPQNSGVKLTFTKLPDPSGNIKIEEITLTQEQIQQTGSLSDKAYDITSDMADGSFSYNLSLPIPESSKGKAVEVKFAEELSNIGSAAKVENTLTTTDTSVSIGSLDHFTIFVVVLYPDYAAPGAGGVYSAYYGPPGHNPVSPGTTTIYDGREAGIIKAGQGADPGAANWDEGLFAFKPTVTINDFAAGTVTYDVENQTGVSPVWMTIEIDTGALNDRSDNTVYQFVPTSNPTGWHTVNAAAGQWQKWNNGAGDTTGNPLISLDAITTAHTSLNVVRAYLRLGMGSAYYNGGTGTIAWVDKAIFGGETYDFSVACSDNILDVPSEFNTIQDAIANATASCSTIRVAAGTYTEVGQIVINKNLSIIGADKTTTIIKTNQDTGNPASGDLRAWFLVNSGVTFNLSNVTLDGLGKLVAIGILSRGNGIIENNVIKNIGYNPSSDYYGRGIQLYDTNMTVRNNTLQNIGRIGIFGFGPGVTSAIIEGNNYSGKGNGNWLDYGIELGGGAVATITNNTINGNLGVASVDGSTSAGIQVTTYFAAGTAATITGNTITNSTYGIAVGYGDGDITSVPQFNTNTFSDNTYDLDNHTVNNIDARNNTWSVVAQDNLDQIEAKINHNCSNSIYVHGVCSGTDDYNTGGMVRYKDIGTPTNSGWNVGSKSSTPNETPLDLACSQYTNENNVAQNWSVVNGANIKYQREVTFPSNAVSNFEAGSNTYTPFSTFGSATGTEGLWKTRVRAYVDANNNNTYDSGEEVSGWSNECNITFDKTVPSTPVLISPSNDAYITTHNFTFLWNASTDDSPLTYEWEFSYLNTTKPDGSFVSQSGDHTNLSTSVYSPGTPDNIYYWHVRAIDSAGNKSAWASPWKVTVDTTAPDAPAPMSPADGVAIKPVAFSQTWTAETGAVQYRYQSCNVDPGDLGGICTSIKFGQTLSGTTKNVGAGQPNSHFWWRVQAKDAAGNWSVYGVAFELTIDGTAPATPTATPVAGDYTSDQSVTLASSDSGSGLKNIYYTLDGTTPNNSKTLYAGIITVDKDMTVKAIAYDNAGNVSGVLEAIYKIAPTISLETESTIGDTTATITWTTDDLATSRVIYDTVSHPDLGAAPNYDYANSTIETDNDPKVTSHSVGLTGLTSGTTYYYRVVSHGSPEAVGPEQSFTTTTPSLTTTISGGGGGGAAAGDGLSDGRSDGRSDGMSPPSLATVLGAFTLAYGGTVEEVLGAETQKEASKSALTPTPTGEISGAILGLNNTVTTPWTWWIFIIGGLLLIIIAIYFYYRQRKDL